MGTLSIERTKSSCAVLDIVGVTYLTKNDIELLLTSFTYMQDGGHPCPLRPFTYFFADRTKPKGGTMYPGNGSTLAEEIEKRQIGKLVSTGEFTNPNNRNGVTAWLWVLTQQDIDKVLKEQEEKLKTDDKPITRKSINRGHERLTGNRRWVRLDA